MRIGGVVISLFQENTKYRDVSGSEDNSNRDQETRNQGGGATEAATRQGDWT